MLLLNTFFLTYLGSDVSLKFGTLYKVEKIKIPVTNLINSFFNLCWFWLFLSWWYLLGYVLGPMLFLLYSTDLDDFIKILHSFDSDDTAIYSNPLDQYEYIQSKHNVVEVWHLVSISKHWEVYKFFTWEITIFTLCMSLIDTYKFRR